MLNWSLSDARLQVKVQGYDGTVLQHLKVVAESGGHDTTNCLESSWRVLIEVGRWLDSVHGSRLVGL